MGHKVQDLMAMSSASKAKNSHIESKNQLPTKSVIEGRMFESCEVEKIGNIEEQPLHFYTGLFYSFYFVIHSSMLTLIGGGTTCFGNSVPRLTTEERVPNSEDLWSVHRHQHGFVIRNRGSPQEILFLERQPKEDGFIVIRLGDRVKINECLNSNVTWQCVFQIHIRNSYAYLKAGEHNLGFKRYQNMHVLAPSKTSDPFVPRIAHVRVSEDVISYDVDPGAGLGGLKSGLVHQENIQSIGNIAQESYVGVDITHENSFSISYDRSETVENSISVNIELPDPLGIADYFAPKISGGYTWKDTSSSGNTSTWTNIKTYTMGSTIRVPKNTEVRYAIMLTYDKQLNGSYTALIEYGTKSNILCETAGVYGEIEKKLPKEFIDRLFDKKLLGHNYENIIHTESSIRLIRKGSFAAEVSLGIFVEAYDLNTPIDEQRPLVDCDDA